jgi:hypothetical protein
MSLVTPLGELSPFAEQPRRSGLTIRVSSGEGEGRTRLSAFDACRPPGWVTSTCCG